MSDIEPYVKCSDCVHQGCFSYRNNKTGKDEFYCREVKEWTPTDNETWCPCFQKRNVIFYDFPKTRMKTNELVLCSGNK